MVLPPPSEPPLSLLYQDEDPLPELDLYQTTPLDLVKRIHELTARNLKCSLEHKGLSHYVITQSDAYKRFYGDATPE